MKCERCFRGEEAKYRVHTDALDVKVCAACAEEARKLGIAFEVLDRREEKTTKARVSLESNKNEHLTAQTLEK